jgi:hypothetical protein
VEVTERTAAQDDRVAMGSAGYCVETLGDHKVLLLWKWDTPHPLLLEQSTCFHGDKRRVPLYLIHFKSVKSKALEISELEEGTRSLCTLRSSMNPLCANREKQSANGLSMEGIDDKGDRRNRGEMGIDMKTGMVADLLPGSQKRPGVPSSWFGKIADWRLIAMAIAL